MRRAGMSVAGSIVALAVAATACGSDSASSGSSSASTGASSSATPAPTTSTGAGATGSSSAAAPSAPAASAGVAPAGSSIKAGASKALPASVSGYAKQAGSGPATIYSAAGKLISVNFLSGSDYAGIVTAIKAQATPAGTGRCGTTSSADNITCYLKAEDGVYNLSADGIELPLPTVVGFANELTAALGTG